MILKDRIAIISGASRGIGLAIAKVFAKEGAEVIISSRKEENLKNAQNEIKEQTNKECLTFAANYSKPEEIEKLINFAISKFGKIDILVNNPAANPVMGAIFDCPLEAWNKIIQTGLTGFFVASKLCAKTMIEKKTKGTIINITSIAGLRATPLLGAYAVAKSGVISLTKNMAFELAPYGIRVNAIAPGLVKTRMSEVLWRAFEEGMTDNPLYRIPLGRVSTPDEIAPIALFLASDSASYITGEVIIVDGGASI